MADQRLSEARRARKRKRRRQTIWRAFSITLKSAAALVLFTFAIFYHRIVKDVYPGEMGVRWHRLGGGTDLAYVYNEGLHLIWPWDEFYIYNMREQEIELETLIYAKDGLEIDVEISVRFRPTPNYLPYLHQDIGPRYVEKVIIPECTSSLRKVLGNYTPEMIYAKDEEGLVDELGRTLRKDLDVAYFEVTEFLVLELRLPSPVEDAIQAKLIEEQRMLSYRFRLQRERDERKRRIIEAEGIGAFEEISGISILKWRGIEATERLAESPNAKIVLMGSGEGQLPVLLNADVGGPGVIADPDANADDGEPDGEPDAASVEGVVIDDESRKKWFEKPLAPSNQETP